jgi:hypothetical protein
VAWPVIVVAATNYVSHNGNHTGSVAPQAATVVVASCDVPLPIVFPIFLFVAGPGFGRSGHSLRSSSVTQDARVETH